ncbi:MAG: dihydrolipoyl dehydrogenase [Methylobacteriaceae bacterium]|jgi:dihydrolipoamide dehydrogenase|nr:dihydrolipoyl dehydrogenase [Methylobacteriaceae bacterium]
MGQIFDVAVIGAGPGGYIAAIRAAQLGFRVVCADRRRNKNGAPTLGGTCLNVGCIPSKALLQSSEHVHMLLNEFADHGITFKAPQFDAVRMIARKNEIVTGLTRGIAGLFKKNRIESVSGSARLAGKQGDNWRVDVFDAGVVKSFEARHVIIATGSSPRSLPGLKIDNVTILDNEGALSESILTPTDPPKRLGIIGAGVIGLELGSVWKRLMSEVTILEALPTFLPNADQQIAREAFRSLTGDTGMKIELGALVKDVAVKEGVVKIAYEVKGEARSLEVDKLIVAVGRGPNTEGLGAREAGLKLDQRGFIEVDDECRTNLPGVWAIGDVVRGPMLAHKASEEGVAVAERIAGQKPRVNLDTIPFIVYTNPELAWVGKTEEQLKADGVDYKKGASSFAYNGRALTMAAAKGFVKILADAKTDRILGVHIFGPMASELIAEAVVAMEFKASAEDLALIVHAHPSLSEVTHEAALAVDKRALHA